MTAKALVDKYLQWGFNVMPARDGEKIPVGKWKPYQREKYPQEEIEEWLSHEKENWVVVCGAISGNLVVVDFDKPELYDQFKKQIPEELLNTFIVKTGKKGYHVYYRTPEPVEGTKIGKIDIQGEGKLAVLPPSIHPETRRRYEIINDKEPLNIDTDAWNHIFTTIKEIAEMEKEKEVVKDKLMKIVETIIPYWREGQRDIMENALVGYMRKKGMPKEYAKFVISAIVEGTNDKEKSMRMAVLERNYRIPESDLKGYTQLRELLPEKELWKLEKQVKAVTGDNYNQHTENTKEEVKKTKIVPYIALPEKLYLAVEESEDKYYFAHLNNGKIELLESIEINGVEHVPRGAEGLPIGYPTIDIVNTPALQTKELVERLKSHIWQYVDLDEDNLDMAVYYILSSWFYRKANTTAYLRILGDTGKGKSRMLKVIGDLCFYPLKLGGNASRAAIMRVQEKYHGTLVLDESDIKGDKEDDLVKYINTGFEKGNKVILVNKNTYNVETFDPFGPKLFAMRHPFGDAATEGRLLSIEPYETLRTDIPAVLPLSYENEVKHLRNTIAVWTLVNWDKVKMENRDFIQRLPIEPRLKQLATPLSIILPLFGEGMDNKFVEWLLRRQEAISRTRANTDEGLVFTAIVDLAMKLKDDEGENKAITTTMIKDETGLHPRRIKKILEELGFEVKTTTKKVDGVRTTMRVITAIDTQRWVESWRRYHWGEEIIDVPDFLRDPRREYVKVEDIMMHRLHRNHRHHGVQEKTNIKDDKNTKDNVTSFSGVRHGSDASDVSDAHLADNDDPFRHNGAKLEINNIRGYKLAPDIPPAIHTDAPAGFTLTFIPSLAAIFPEPPQYEHMELLKDINGIALPDHNIPPVKRGEVIPTSKKVLKIMEKRGIAKRTTAEISFSVLFRNLPEEQIDIPKGMALKRWKNDELGIEGDIGSMWVSSGCAKVEA